MQLIARYATGAINEAWEDVNKHRADKVANNRKCKTLDESSHQLVDNTSKNLKVGQILKVTEGEEFPADLMLVSSSLADGTCYVNTANLDGEAAPKVRISAVQLMNMRSTEEIAELSGRVQVEQPSPSMYHLQGSCTLTNTHNEHNNSNSVEFPIGDKQLLLRGSKLVNTPSVYGLVVYVGGETKLMLNRSIPSYKFSRFEKVLNRLVVAILIFNAVICLMPAIYLVSSGEAHSWGYAIAYGYTNIVYNSFVDFLLGFVTQYILFSWMVPISLYVTIALVKVAQAKLMEWDLDMSIEGTNDETGEPQRKYMKVKSAALNEELGVIDAVCSDKTGTLTQNKMELSRVSITQKLYWDKDSDYAAHKLQTRRGSASQERRLSRERSDGTSSNDKAYQLVSDLCMHAYGYLIDAQGNKGGSRNARLERRDSEEEDKSIVTHRHFILCILLCNAVLPGPKTKKQQKAEEHADDATSEGAVRNTLEPPGEMTGHLQQEQRQNGHTDDNDADARTASEHTQADILNAEMQFQSQSPDEIALCEALDRCGITLLSRTGNNLSVRIHLKGMQKPVVFTYNVIATLDFSSVWRRMCVVVEDSDKQMYLYNKGADSTIQPLLSMQTAEEKARWKTTDQHAEEFASSGSRTLVFAGRRVSKEEYTQWRTVYEESTLAMQDRELRIEQSFKKLEHDMELLGCSAVDDQLQEYVPETIDFLLAAGLKVIVVTGDKMETAVTISKQAHLVQPHAKVMYLNGLDREACKQSLYKNLRTLHLPIDDDDISNTDIASAETPSTATNTNYALAVDGVALELLLAYHPKPFFRLFNAVSAIVCYRSTPLQKAMVVRLVKKEMHLTTLAIGDGANDVSMILEAHVGVGILGKEGAHAAMSSDFVIHRFYHLKKLLVIHGRYNYFRLIQVVLFSFYKGLAYQLPLFWFQWWCLGSGATFFDSILQTCWNLFFTSVPPFFVGMFDKDVLEPVLLRIPAAYTAFKRKNTFSIPVFLYTLGISVYQSVIVYFFTYGYFYNNEVMNNGQSTGLFYMGHTVLTSLVILINLRMLLLSEHMNGVNVFGVAFMFMWYIGVFLFVSVAYQLSLSPNAYGTGILFTQGGPWFIILSTIVAGLIPDTLLLCYRKLYHPYLFEQLQRLEAIPIENWPKQIELHEPIERSFLPKQHSESLTAKGTDPHPTTVELTSPSLQKKQNGGSFRLNGRSNGHDVNGTRARLHDGSDSSDGLDDVDTTKQGTREIVV